MAEKLVIDVGSRVGVRLPLTEAEDAKIAERATVERERQDAEFAETETIRQARPGAAIVQKLRDGTNLTAAESQAVLRFLALHYVRSRDSE